MVGCKANSSFFNVLFVRIENKKREKKEKMHFCYMFGEGEK